MTLKLLVLLTIALFTAPLAAQVSQSAEKPSYPPRPLTSDWQQEELRGRVKVVQERWAIGGETRQYDEYGFLYRSHVRGGSTQWLDSSVFEGQERRTYSTFSDYRTGEMMAAPRSIKMIRWDSAGRVTERQFIDFETKQVRSSEAFRYDASGKLIEKQYRDFSTEPSLSSSPASYTEFFTYGKGSQPTRISRKDTLGLTTEEKGFEYDACGRIARRSEREPPEPFVWLTAKYNKQGDLIEESAVYRGMKVAEKYTYEYDERGNWITKTKTLVGPKEMMKKAKPPEVTYRQIVYFD